MARSLGEEVEDLILAAERSGMDRIVISLPSGSRTRHKSFGLVVFRSSDREEVVAAGCDSLAELAAESCLTEFWKACPPVGKEGQP